MKIRLIDADKVIEELKKDRDYAEKNGFMDMYFERQTLIERINMQPTAYDPDKVVERLEELNKYNLNLADCMLDIQSHGLNRHFICLEDAIEIVKAGGLNAKTDS